MKLSTKTDLLGSFQPSTAKVSPLSSSSLEESESESDESLKVSDEKLGPDDDPELKTELSLSDEDLDLGLLTTDWEIEFTPDLCCNCCFEASFVLERACFFFFGFIVKPSISIRM